MRLTKKSYDVHVASWQSRLTKSGGRPYRQHWPGRLFHHAPLENAVGILTSGELLSRTASTTIRKLDVADPNVISATTVAHDFVRFYFRPRTPTQYHVEGIKKSGDLLRPNVHAPVLVIFVFDALSVLSQSGVRVSDGNMQSSFTSVYDTEEGLYELDFDSIYHDGAFDSQSSAGRDIVRARCAEVLAPSPFLLSSGLQAVMCRSAAERATLLYLLPAAIRRRWLDKIRVHSEPGLFENRFAFVKSVDATKTRTIFTLSARHDAQKIDFRLELHACRRRKSLRQASRQLR
jgi:hypothetical protein